MANVIGTITGAFDAYSENWRKVVVPFAVLVAIGFVFWLVTLGISLVSEGVCKVADDPYVLIAFCYFPQVIEWISGIVQELVGLIVIMAVLVPLWEIANRKPMSSWTEHAGRQLFNALKVIVVRLGLSLVIFSPLIIFIALNIAGIIAVVESVPADADQVIVITALVGSLGMVVAAIILSIVLGMFLNFFLTFFEIEVAVGGKGIVEAVQSSANMVLANFLDTLVFNILWWAIGMSVSILVLFLFCTVCLIPVAFLFSPLVVVPIMWLSKLLLWKEFGGGSEKGIKRRL